MIAIEATWCDECQAFVVPDNPTFDEVNYDDWGIMEHLGCCYETNDDSAH